MKRFDCGVRSSVQTNLEELKRRQGRLGDIWHLDEVFIRINGQQNICGVPWIKTAI
jgi:transposase-like protein